MSNKDEVEELAKKAIEEGCYVCDLAEATSVIQWILDQGYTRPLSTPSPLVALDLQQVIDLMAEFYPMQHSSREIRYKCAQAICSKFGKPAVTEEDILKVLERFPGNINYGNDEIAKAIMDRLDGK